jgi:hypothetical protein
VVYVFLISQYKQLLFLSILQTVIDNVIMILVTVMYHETLFYISIKIELVNKKMFRGPSGGNSYIA